MSSDRRKKEEGQGKLFYSTSEIFSKVIGSDVGFNKHHGNPE
jgi:hypothetical protein